MKNITGRFLTLAFGSVIAISSFAVSSCRQDFPSQIDSIFVHDTLIFDSCDLNLLLNGGFALASTGTHDLGYGEMSGWDPYKGTPQAVPANTGRQGVLQMWGNGDPSIGEGVTQTLHAPLVAGTSYAVTADFCWWNDNPSNYTPYARLRFLAYDDSGNSETIGTLQTSSTSWVSLKTSAWTASRAYTHFAVMVEDDNVGDNSATWAHVDQLKLTVAH